MARRVADAACLVLAQHQLAMAAMGHLSAPPSPQRQHQWGSGRGSRRSSASSIGRHTR